MQGQNPTYRRIGDQIGTYADMQLPDYFTKLRDEYAAFGTWGKPQSPTHRERLDQMARGTNNPGPGKSRVLYGRATWTTT